MSCARSRNGIPEGPSSPSSRPAGERRGQAATRGPGRRVAGLESVREECDGQKPRELVSLAFTGRMAPEGSPFEAAAVCHRGERSRQATSRRHEDPRPGRGIRRYSSKRPIGSATTPSRPSPTESSPSAPRLPDRSPYLPLRRPDTGDLVTAAWRSCSHQPAGPKGRSGVPFELHLTEARHKARFVPNLSR